MTGQGVNDVFNRGNQKSLASTSQPFLFVVGFNYETPKLTENRVDPERGRRLDLGRVDPLHERNCRFRSRPRRPT